MSQMPPASSLHQPLPNGYSHTPIGQDPFRKQTKLSSQPITADKVRDSKKSPYRLQEPCQHAPLGCDPHSVHGDGDNPVITTPPSSPRSAEEIWDEAEARARRKERRQADPRRVRRHVFGESLMVDLRADTERSLSLVDPISISSTSTHGQTKGLETSAMTSLGAAQKSPAKPSVCAASSQPLRVQRHHDLMPSPSQYENLASTRVTGAKPQKAQSQSHQTRINNPQPQFANHIGNPPTTPPRSRQGQFTSASAASQTSARSRYGPSFGSAVPLQPLQTSPAASCRSGETLVEILPEPASPTAAHRASYSLQQYISVFEKDDDDDPKTGLIGHLKWPLHVSRGSFSGEKTGQGMKRWMLRILRCGCAPRES